MAAWVQDMFCNFYLVKSHKIDNNSATTEARGKISTYLESLEFKKFLCVCLIKIENYQILLNNISHIFQLITMLFNGQKSPIKTLQLFSMTLN